MGGAGWMGAVAYLLLVEAAVFDAADEIVESFALDDPVQGHFVAFLAVGAQRCGVGAFGYPECVPELEGSHDRVDAFFA